MFLIYASLGFLPLALLLTAVSSIILGMGLPTTAAYLMQAALVIPALIKLGVEPLAANLFSMYFACISALTPPVAISSYAAAGIADADPMKVSWTAMRLDSVAYVVPFMFIYGPALLLKGSWVSIALAVTTAIIGVVSLASAVSGFFRSKISFIERLLFGMSSLLLLYPHRVSDAVGFVIFLLLVHRRIVQTQVVDS